MNKKVQPFYNRSKTFQRLSTILSPTAIPSTVTDSKPTKSE